MECNDLCLGGKTDPRHCKKQIYEVRHVFCVKLGVGNPKIEPLVLFIGFFLPVDSSLEELLDFRYTYVYMSIGVHQSYKIYIYIYIICIHVCIHISCMSIGMNNKPGFCS